MENKNARSEKLTELLDTPPSFIIRHGTVLVIAIVSAMLLVLALKIFR